MGKDIFLFSLSFSCTPALLEEAGTDSEQEREREKSNSDLPLLVCMDVRLHAKGSALHLLCRLIGDCRSHTITDITEMH